MTKDKINYVQLEPAAFLSDEDYQMMTDAERGIYCTVIFYMLCNNGRIKKNIEGIKRLCNSDENFGQKWESVKSKFYQKGDWLRHRRVDSELKKARELLQSKRRGGLKTAEKRWGANSTPIKTPVAKGREGKVREGKVNTPPIPPQKINPFVGYWNSKDTLPRIRDFTKGREQKLKARFQEQQFAENWQLVIDKLSQSRFHTGNNDRGWRANVDWLLKNDTNWVKILELDLSKQKPAQENQAVEDVPIICTDEQLEIANRIMAQEKVGDNVG